MEHESGIGNFWRHPKTHQVIVNASVSTEYAKAAEQKGCADLGKNDRSPRKNECPEPLSRR